MDGPPPNKRSRSELAPQENEDAEDYIEHLGTDVIERGPNFNLIKCLSNFMIKALPEDPEGLLAGIFQYCIDRAIEECQKMDLNPTHLGCLINSQLLDHAMWIPVGPITDDTVPSILNRFLLIAQSKKQQGVTLWGEPFSFNVTAVDRSSLPFRRQITGGRLKGPPSVQHQIKECSLIRIRNLDNYCLFYALQATMVRATRRMHRRLFERYVKSQFGQSGQLEREGKELMRAVGAPEGLQKYDAWNFLPLIVNYWNQKYKGMHRFKVFVFGARGRYEPILKEGPNDYDTPILLFHDGDHFHGVRSSSALFGKPYCLACEHVYSKPRIHAMRCPARCIKCSKMGGTPCEKSGDFYRFCHRCDKEFFNKNCYHKHLSSNFCNNSKLCRKCGLTYNMIDLKRNGQREHKCNERYCKTCNSYHDAARGCFMIPQEVKQTEPCRFVAFDLETMQYEPVNPDSPHKRNHVPNFIAARVACQECIGNGKWKESLLADGCKVCGKHRIVTFSERDFKETQVDKKVVTEQPLRAFVNWILYDLPIKFNTYAFSHFGGRFDMVLTFKELFLHQINPKMIRKGNKLYDLAVKSRPRKNPNIYFRDSWNLLNMKLDSLVTAFDLDVQPKPYFPHLANCRQNYGREILLKESDFLANGFTPSKRREFDQWFAQHKDEPFNLDESLASYCTNDVDILMAGLIVFRKEFMEMTKRAADEQGKVQRAASNTAHEGICPLRTSMTIASACMRHFMTNHLKEQHLALVPELGYDRVDRQSLLGLKFLQWYAEKNKVKVQHALSPGGEKKIGNYKLDGWVEEKQLALEVNGCWCHGCERCYPNDNDMLPKGVTAGHQRERERQRMDFIQSQVPHVKVYWECEIEEMLKQDPEMQQKFDTYLDRGPIDIRSCFYGGRTAPLMLYYKAQPGERISYYDVTSLYPFVNFITGYPIGHPIVHVFREDEEDVCWTAPEHNPYPLALIKCFVMPPRQIDVPVLPVKLDKERLLFPLCAACGKKYPQGAVKENYSCTHDDAARGFVWSGTSIELNEALKENYRVTKLFRVLEYTESDNELFRPYMREFLAEKIHSSGFDERIRGNPDAEAQFIRECEERFGIVIDPAMMISNKAKRALVKLCVNNLWGRFSLRNFGLMQSYITDDPAELGRFLDRRDIEIAAIDQLTPQTILISFTSKKEWVEEHKASNVVISLWTTSAARLLLLKAMQTVVRSPGCKLLYTDTDSLIFVHPEQSNPLELGPHIGQFTDEYPHHEILEFCSGGAKQYGLKLRRRDAPTDAPLEYCLKLRGISLSYDVVENQGLKYERFKEQVLKYAKTGRYDPIHILYPNFLRPNIKTGSVTSEPRRKIYRPFVGKGIVRPSDFRVLDFGYICVH